MTDRTTKTTAWQHVTETLGSTLTGEEREILQLLQQGKTQPEIADALRLHRSAVWRRVNRLLRRASAGDDRHAQDGGKA